MTNAKTPMPRRRAPAKRPRKALNKGQRKQVAQVAKRVLNNRTETKIYDFPISSAISLSGTIFSMVNITQGDAGLDNRDGQEILPTALKVHLTACKGDTQNFMRFVLFKWKPDSAVFAPTATDILKDAGTSNSAISHYNYLTRGQYTILYDKKLYMESNDSTCQWVNLMIPGKRLGKVRYNVGSNTGTGHIYALAVSDSGAVSHPQLEAECRLFFKDS